MRAVTFLTSLFLLVFSLMMIAHFLFLDPYEIASQARDGYQGLINSVSTLFRFADHWNCIAITFFLAISVIALCLNNALLQWYCARVFYPPCPSFWKGGLRWLARSILSFGMFSLEVIAFCYAVNVMHSFPLVKRPSDIRDGKYIVLLLGTSKHLKGSAEVNRYYLERIHTCHLLYKNGVIGELVISGDRNSTGYDETADMRSDLIKLGVCNIPITLDPFGYRTFDSIRRIKEKVQASGQRKILIVSQYFHLQRALYLAGAEKIDALGVVAQGSMTPQMIEREFFAKTKVLLDLYVFNTQTQGVQTAERRLVDLSSSVDLLLLGFVLATVAMAGRMFRFLIRY